MRRRSRTRPLSASGRLRLKIALAEGALGAVTRAFWTHPRVRRALPEYLSSLYWSMQATVPLLHTAAARCRELGASDRVATRLRPYFLEHAREERDHDRWLLEDIEALGGSASLVTSAAPPADVASMIGAQYFWLRHAHPVALLGCFAVLEGRPLSPADVDGFAARARVPRSGLRTLYKHADLDPGHRDDLDAIVDALPLSSAQETLTGLSALTVCEQLAGILGRLYAIAESRGRETASA